MSRNLGSFPQVIHRLTEASHTRVRGAAAKSLLAKRRQPARATKNDMRRTQCCLANLLRRFLTRASRLAVQGNRPSASASHAGKPLTQPAPSTMSSKRPRSGSCLFHLSSGLKPFGSRGGSNACGHAPLTLGRVGIGKPLQIAGWRRQGCNVCLTARTACPSNLYLASDRAKKSSCFHGVVGIVRCSGRPPAFALHAPPRQAGRNTKDEGGLWSYRVEVLAPEMRTKNLGARA
jgi:hypothetical protein